MSGEPELITTLTNKVRLIKFNRPKAKNAINRETYKAVSDILNADAENPSVLVTIITGTGDYFTSGNDMKSALAVFQETGQKSGRPAKELINAMINYPKLLIAVVNGPALGIGCTMLPLCDVAYASDKATFETPFVRLGLCAEGGSSYTFPRIMGRSRASELLFLNRVLNAKEALECGLIAKVVKHKELEKFIKGLYRFGELPTATLMANKRLVNLHLKEKLLQCNELEMEQLEQCLESEDATNAIMNFLQRKSKL